MDGGRRGGAAVATVFRHRPIGRTYLRSEHQVSPRSRVQLGNACSRQLVAAAAPHRPPSINNQPPTTNHQPSTLSPFAASLLRGFLRVLRVFVVQSLSVNETLDRFFKLRERGTNIRTELVAGFTTFAAMAYILAVNPQILS